MEQLKEHQVNTYVLPREYSQCPMDHFLRLIARMLSSLIYMNDYKLRAHEFLRQKQHNAATNDTNLEIEYNKGKHSFQKNINSSSMGGTPASNSGDSFFSAGTPISVFNSSLPISTRGIVLTRFHSKTPPKISVLDYLYRLTKFSNLDHTVLLATLSYIDLLMIACPAFEINSLTVHRFLLTATTVACKGLRDSFYTNEHYAKVGGVHVSELNILEQELLVQINYRILPRELASELLRVEIENKKFVVFPPEGNTIKPVSMNEYDVLTKIYHNMIELVGPWESVIYVSDRLPMFFSTKDQQNLLKHQRSMWAKDVNFIENSKHRISYILSDDGSLLRDNSVPKESPHFKEQYLTPDPHAEKRKADFSQNHANSSDINFLSPEKKRKLPDSTIPAELLANYFDPEIFKQTQIKRSGTYDDDNPLGTSHQTKDPSTQDLSGSD
jgi:hypothetical protein